MSDQYEQEVTFRSLMLRPQQRAAERRLWWRDWLQRRRRLQFSLAALLWFVVGVSVFCSVATSIGWDLIWERILIPLLTLGDR